MSKSAVRSSQCGSEATVARLAGMLELSFGAGSARNRWHSLKNGTSLVEVEELAPFAECSLASKKLVKRELEPNSETFVSSYRALLFSYQAFIQDFWLVVQDIKLYHSFVYCFKCQKCIISQAFTSALSVIQFTYLYLFINLLSIYQIIS
jgi:hypothetical protein